MTDTIPSRRAAHAVGRAAGLVLKPLARHRRKPDPLDAQTRQLTRLIDTARPTRFGQDHRFDIIDGIGTFQQHVPLRSYERMWREYWEPAFPRLDDVSWPGVMPYFARSSGTTTGESKYIPVSQQMVKANTRAGMEVVYAHLARRPDSTVLRGRTFLFGGSPNLEQLTDGTFAGELSGIAARETPTWVGRDRYYPPDQLASITDWEAKVDIIARHCIGNDIRSISGVPTWLKVLFDRAFDTHDIADHQLSRLFPDLELITHGGINFAPHRYRFEQMLQTSRAELREVYAASEAFIAVADRGPGEGMRLLIDNGVFYEFIPIDSIDDPDPPRLWLADVDLDTDYAVAVTTCAGVWAYLLGDVIRFVDLDPHRLLVVGRVSQTLSAFGEHVSGSQLEIAVAAAAHATHTTVADFAVAPVLHDRTSPAGHHRYLVEAHLPTPTAQHQFGEILDQSLTEQNADYRAKRGNDIVLGPPEIIPAARGAFTAWMASRGQLGGQHKVKRVVDEELLDAMSSQSAPTAT